MALALLCAGAFGVVQAAAAESAGRLFIYPSKGQTQAQLDKDRYECHAWARTQSGFDPSAGTLAPPPAEPVHVPANPNAGATTAGTVTGAVIGGAVGAHHGDTLEGVAIGAILGAIAGGSIETQGEVGARRAAEARQDATRDANERALAQQREAYGRAISACLEGRGYTVR